VVISSLSKSDIRDMEQEEAFVHITKVKWRIYGKHEI